MRFSDPPRRGLRHTKLRAQYRGGRPFILELLEGEKEEEEDVNCRRGNWRESMSRMRQGATWRCRLRGQRDPEEKFESWNATCEIRVPFTSFLTKPSHQIE